jgi:hypothetical protein
MAAIVDRSWLVKEVCHSSEITDVAVEAILTAPGFA